MQVQEQLNFTVGGTDLQKQLAPVQSTLFHSNTYGCKRG